MGSSHTGVGGMSSENTTNSVILCRKRKGKIQFPNQYFGAQNEGVGLWPIHTHIYEFGVCMAVLSALVVMTWMLSPTEKKL